ncbi:MAG TPA: hypothetical protein VHX65_14275 [Pirellulales bacterium]|jgi:hypothetical protein|nr:hypothetical protein [Pirellulales bacterium]
MIQRFNIPEPGDEVPRDLLNRSDSLEISIHRLNGATAFTFKLSGSSGDIFPDDDDDSNNGSAKSADFQFLRTLVEQFEKRGQPE